MLQSRYDLKARRLKMVTEISQIQRKNFNIA